MRWAKLTLRESEYKWPGWRVEAIGIQSVPAMRETGLDPVRLIQVYQAGVWRYLRVLGCEASLADDLTQETFLAILNRPFEDVSATATAAYLRKTALHLYISHHRRMGRMRTEAEIENLDTTWTAWAGN